MTAGTLLVGLVLLAPQAAAAPLRLAPLLGDHAVLQQGRPVLVWGWAAPGQKVEVQFHEHRLTTTAADDGRWQVVLPAMEATGQGSDLTVTAGGTRVLHDVVVGEVWLCSGQSNMEWHVERASNAAEEVAAADLPLVRHFRVPHVAAERPGQEFSGAWTPASPQTVPGFSAVAWFFARDLHRALHVPIGLVNASWGGKMIEVFLSPEALAGDPAFAAVQRRWEEERDRPGAKPAEVAQHRPACVFNGMIAPLIPCALRGVIWYQGEHNVMRAGEYQALFTALIGDWRRRFGQGELPFYFVQLTSYDSKFDRSGEAYAQLREAQTRSLCVPHTGMAVTIDVGAPETAHAPDKQDVSARLARIAKAQVYGLGGVWSGPVLRSATCEAHAVRLTFDHVHGGLMLREKGASEKGARNRFPERLAGDSAKTVPGTFFPKAFELAGADGKFQAAEARLDGADLIVQSPTVPEPVEVRYAWANAPQAILFNGEGLPAGPFRCRLAAAEARPTEPRHTDQAHPAAEPDPLLAGFRALPASARPQAWWHWINGSISKEGIRADLEDMRRVGLGGVHLFDVDTKLPPGPIRYGTEAWFEHVRYAIQTADELGLQVTLQNCPGWSTSGGPWVKVADSMKRLVWSETPVDGPRPLRQRLPQPPAEMDFYRDVALLAVPADPLPDGLTPAVTSSLAGLDLRPLADGDLQTAVELPKDAGRPTFTLTYPRPVERRLLEIVYPASSKGVKVHVDARLEASDDGTTFRKLRDFSHGGMLFRGGEIAVSVPFVPTTARAFRVVFKAPPAPLNLAEIRFSNAARIENFPGKSAASSLGRVLTDAAPAPLDDPGAIPLAGVIDLTARLADDGTLDWQVPAGRWTVLRFGYTTTGMLNHPAQAEATGLEADKLDAAAVNSHFEHALGRLLADAGRGAGCLTCLNPGRLATCPTTELATGPTSGLTGILIDSWEARQQNWTAAFPAEFRARRGYELLAFLPAVTGRVVQSPADSEAFLRDFRRTISDLVAENHFGLMQRLAHQRGLQLFAEAYGGRTFDEFQCGARVDVPTGEFWYGRSPGRIKLTASLAHTTGRPLVAAESYTAVAQDAGWSKTPWDLKPFGDAAFAGGLNLTLLHEYAHQPRSDLRPGFALGSAGTNFGRLNSWWPLARPWIEYLARCQFLLQQGQFAADFLLLRNTDLGSFVDDRYVDLPPGYDYDQVAAQQLLEATADGRAIRLAAGARYHLLLLPQIWVADAELIEHLQNLVRSGVPVVGPPPLAPAGRKDLQDGMRAWKALVQELWSPRPDVPRVQPAEGLNDPARFRESREFCHSERSVESGVTQGKILRCAQDDSDLKSPGIVQGHLESLLEHIGLEPDFRYTAEPAAAEIHWLHRRTAAAEIYFLCTAAPQPVVLEADFRVSGKQPELWDPDSGRIAPLPRFEAQGSHTRLSLTLPPVGSTFVVFRQGAVPFGTPDDPHTLPAAAADQPPPIAVPGPWKVTFQPPGRQPFERQFAELHSWPDDADAAVRYFSGIATYAAAFDLPAAAASDPRRCQLDLGTLYDLAEVRVNGQPAGGFWKPPFTLDVTAQVRPGRNTLEVDVANRWTNRLRGDAQFPPDAQYQTRFQNNPVSYGLLAEFPEWYSDPAQAAARQRQTFVTYNPYFKPQSPLAPSGLLGPVTIR